MSKSNLSKKLHLERDCLGCLGWYTTTIPSTEKKSSRISHVVSEKKKKLPSFNLFYKKISQKYAGFPGEKKSYHIYCLKWIDKSKGLFSLFADKCTSDDSRLKTLKFDNKTTIYGNSYRLLGLALRTQKVAGISEKFLIQH